MVNISKTSKEFQDTLVEKFDKLNSEKGIPLGTNFIHSDSSLKYDPSELRLRIILTLSWDENGTFHTIDVEPTVYDDWTNKWNALFHSYNVQSGSPPIVDGSVSDAFGVLTPEEFKEYASEIFTDLSLEEFNELPFAILVDAILDGYSLWTEYQLKSSRVDFDANDTQFKIFYTLESVSNGDKFEVLLLDKLWRLFP